MKLSAVDRRQILITVKTVNMQRKLYLENVRCKVYFFDQSKNQVGDQLFNFTDRKTPTLSAGESYSKQFPIVYDSTQVRGDYMFYKIYRLGGKGDEGKPPEFVKDGRTRAELERKGRSDVP